MVKLYVLLIFILSYIQGCSSIDYSDPGRMPKAQLPPVEERGESDSYHAHPPKVITTAALETSPVKKKKKRSYKAKRQAVLDLLAQSKQAIDEQRYEEAETLLKRAIRIEPRNAWLWHNLAVIKFYLADYEQAIQQALKSNNLEKQDKKLRDNNQKIINQSRYELKQIK